ncbi:MAG: hypothetical protein U0805_03035 [Pirellulales bacterium]
MFSSNSVRLAVVAGLFLLGAGSAPAPAPAAQLTSQIHNSDDLVVPVFDSSLGTLTGVSLSIVLLPGNTIAGGAHDHATFPVYSSNVIETSLVNPFTPFQLTIDPTGSTNHSAMLPVYSGGGLTFAPFTVPLYPSGYHGHSANVAFAGMQQIGFNAYRMVASIDATPDSAGHAHSYSATGITQNYSGSDVVPFLASSNIVIPAGPFFTYPDGGHAHSTPPFSQTVNTAVGNRTLYFSSSQVPGVSGHDHQIDPRFDVTATFTYDPVSVTTSQVGVAYVANTGSDSVSIISLPTQSVVNTISVGDEPRYVAFNRSGSRAYVTNMGSDTVSVIDTAAQTVVNTIHVGDQPDQIVIINDGQRAYVANYNSASISVIDLATNTVSSFGTPPNPSSLAIHPTRDELWIGFSPTSGNTVLEARSLADHSVLDTENSSSRYYAASDLAIAPDGSMAIGSEACGLCGRFHKLSGSLPLTVTQADILYNNQGAARGIAINPVNNVAYLAKLGQNGNPHRLTELGGAGRSITTGDPRELAVSPDGKYIYLTQGNGTLAVIDAASFATLNSINVGTIPQGVALQPPPLVTGDFNRDGVVDAADFILWRNTKGTTVLSLTGADADGNGTIDDADYNLWRSNFGRMAGSGASSTSPTPIPEPACVGLLIASLLLAAPVRRTYQRV